MVLSAPSGAGKNTVLAHVLPRVERLTYSISCTTRPARQGERDGVDYYFLTEDEFDRRIKAGAFLDIATIGDETHEVFLVIGRYRPLRV